MFSARSTRLLAVLLGLAFSGAALDAQTGAPAQSAATAPAQAAATTPPTTGNQTAAPTSDTNAAPLVSGTETTTTPTSATTNGTTVLPEITVTGRQDSLIGIADSATQGTVGAPELADRPLLRTGEILETVPGVIITQHAGGGKANQYFLRGFNLDHGTDFATDLEGMPLNLPTHAHGQGYSDLNIVIPELIDTINYEKGPYYAANGDFSTVGAAHLVFADTLPEGIFKIAGGTDDYGRTLVADSLPFASGNLLYGAEVFHENGPWAVPDDYLRFNGLLKYSTGDDMLGSSVIAMAYHGKWNSTDQIAENAVSTGLIPFYGSLSPTDGGNSQRYSLQAEWHNENADTATHLMAYAFYYDLDLFSDFTYYLESPQGDQFEQQDGRKVFGLKGSQTFYGKLAGRDMENTFGLQFQNSWIDTGLYQTVDDVRTDKVDYLGNPIPAITKVDVTTETSLGLYYDNKVQWAEKFRSELGFREDIYDVSVNDYTNSANSGHQIATLPSPKLSLIFGPWDKTEFYTQAGFGFHSNDARATTATVNPDGSSVGTNLPLLVHAYGGEVGVRTSAVPHLQSTLSVWYLHNNSELYFDGIDADSGDTTASQQSTHRYGVEWANYYTPVKGVTFDLDLADSWAYFDSPTTAAEDITPGGSLVAEAIHESASGGVTAHQDDGWSESLRLRFLAPARWIRPAAPNPTPP